jgi:hypothetical protein
LETALLFMLLCVNVEYRTFVVGRCSDVGHDEMLNAVHMEPVVELPLLILETPFSVVNWKNWMMLADTS